MTRERQAAIARLRRFEGAGRAGPGFDAALDAAALGLVPDADRLAAPLLERLGVRGRVQLVLWSAAAAVFLCTLVSFFSAPLMDAGLAATAALVTGMLVLSYMM